MDSGHDFSYFNTAPVPYNFFGLPPTPQSDTPRPDQYKNFHVNNVSPAASTIQATPDHCFAIGTL